MNLKATDLQHNNMGFSLVEMIVAIGMGSIVAAAISASVAAS